MSYRESNYWEFHGSLENHFLADGHLDERERALLGQSEGHGWTVEAIADLACRGRVSRDLVRLGPEWLIEAIRCAGIARIVRWLGARLGEVRQATVVETAAD